MTTALLEVTVLEAGWRLPVRAATIHGTDRLRPPPVRSLVARGRRDYPEAACRPAGSGITRDRMSMSGAKGGRSRPRIPLMTARVPGTSSLPANSGT